MLPELYLARWHLAVHLPSLWAQFGSWCFTKIMKPVMTLRLQGIRSIIYLNDILLFHLDPHVICTQTSWVIDWLQPLGFLVKFQKSYISPSQRIEFLGFEVDLVYAVLLLPAAKILAIKKELRIALWATTITLRILARLVGLLSASIQAIFPGPLHNRKVQHLKARHLRSNFPYDHQITLDPEAHSELHWWLHHMKPGMAEPSSEPT